MRSIAIHAALCVAAAIVPLASSGTRENASDVEFPGWPTAIEGRVLRQIPMSAREQQFSRGFPGRIGRFTDGEREIVIRWVTTASRKLHPASDCFKGLGFSIKPLPARSDKDAVWWSCFEAVRGKERLVVRERIHDGHGKTWTDVSCWYWSALLGETNGPWWAVTVAESQQSAARE